MRIRKIVNNLLLLATTLHVCIMLFTLLILYLLVGDSANHVLCGNASVYFLTLGKYTDMLARCIETYP